MGGNVRSVFPRTRRWAKAHSRAALVTAAVVLIAGCSSGSSGQLAKLRARDGACLASAGISLDGATEDDGPVSGYKVVWLSDGAEFAVADSDGHIEPGNRQAGEDLTAGSCPVG